jgi:hypothetical protein
MGTVQFLYSLTQQVCVYSNSTLIYQIVRFYSLGYPSFLMSDMDK